MDGRLNIAKDIKSKDGALITAIDENEFSRLSMYLESEFDFFETDSISIIHNPAGVQGDNFSYSHEYAIYTYEKQKNLIGQTLRDEPSIEAFRDWGGTSSRKLAKNCFYPIFVKNDQIVGFGEVCEDEFHPEDSNVVHGDLIYVYPISDDGEERKWVFSRDSVEGIKDNLIVNNRNGKISISRKKTETSYKTTWFGNNYYANIYGSKFLNNILGEKRFDFPKSIYTLEQCLWAVNSFRRLDSITLDYFGGSGTTGHAVINTNRRDNGNRKFILIEMGDHFNSVILPRIIKASFSPKWKKGIPKNNDEAIPAIYKVMRLESYEDALNNLELKRQKADLFDENSELKDDYLMNYMLYVESRGSLLSTSDFQKPFNYSMNITTESAGAFKEKKVDLVETFNYLIGLTVKHIDAQPERGYITVAGTLPTEESCLILWRDCDLIDYEGLNKLCDKLAINPADNEFDVVYINGDHNIPTVLTQTAEEGGETRVLKLRQIEPEFLERMFAEEDV